MAYLNGYVCLLRELVEKKRMHHHALITSKSEAITLFLSENRGLLTVIENKIFSEWPRE